MIKKAVQNDEPFLKKLLGLNSDADTQNTPYAALNYAVQDDVFLLRIKSSFTCYGIEHPDCEFYFVTKEKENAQDRELGILCVQGKSCIYAGPLQNSEEIENFLSFLQIDSFTSNNMVLLNFNYTPQYLMCLEKGVAEDVFCANLDVKPDLWRLSQSGVLTDIDPNFWYGDATIRAKHKIGHVMAVNLINNDGESEYVSTAGVYAMDDNNIYITAVETKSEHRKKGYASALIYALANLHKNKNAYVLCSPDLGHFYEGLGFKFMRPICMCTRPKS